MSRRRKQAGRHIRAAIEVTGSHLHLIRHEDGAEGQVVRSRSIRWRSESSGVTLEPGPQELSAALLSLVQDEQLHGSDVRIVLGAEFCVTRYVSGPTRKVEERVAELETECSRFLLLGQGRKLAASHVSQLPDGDYRGLVSAFNRRALDVILQVCSSLELRVGGVYAAAVLLAGLVHSIDPENSGGLFVRLRDDCVDVLIVDQGCLLLDVRPARQLKVEDLCEFTSERRALLDRFYRWHSLTQRRQLQCVYVAGRAEAATVRSQLLDSGLAVHAISDLVAGTDWGMASDLPSGYSVAALAAISGLLPGTEEIDCPDLLSVLQNRETHSLRSRLKQTLWPIAAAAVLCLMFHLLKVREIRNGNQTRPALAAYQELRRQIDSLSRDRLDLDTEIEHVDLVWRQSRESSWNLLMTSVAGCLPDDGSLTTWVLSGDGTLRLRGRCEAEESAYEFVEYIGRLPQIRKASLTGTKNGVGAERSVVEFDVVAEMRSTEVESRLADGRQKTVR